MKKLTKIVIALLIASAIVVGVTLLLKGINIDVLNPRGEIAIKERDLIVFTLLLSLVIVVPVFVMLVVFSLRYREGNKKATYRPNWDGNKYLEFIWWGIPCIFIFILSVVTWQSSHDLDPYKDINSSVKPINVQVVSLQWKWLFIYPDLGVASVNELNFPEKTPVNFTITSDAPMNSFWIPSLGGQVYAMSGMSTELRLIADSTGEYRGSSANLSGRGFADMKFMANSRTQADFDEWTKTTSVLPTKLNMTSYAQLTKQSTQEEPLFYALEDHNLYDKIVMKYMAPAHQHNADKAETEEPMNTSDAHMDHQMEGM